MSAAAEQLSSELELILVTVGSDLLPEYLMRVMNFCVKYDPRVNPEFLARSIVDDALNDRRRYCLPAILRDGKMVGHGLIEVCHYDEGSYAHITQTALDKGAGVEFEAIPGLIEALTDWCRKNNCRGLQAWVDEGAQERRMRMLHGYKRYKIIVRREIDA